MHVQDTTATVTRRIVRQRAEDLARLADQGARNGVRVLVDHRTGQHVATSATNPSACYHVDAERGCTCKGYAVWARCQHHSLLLAELGRIPDGDLEPEPTPAVRLVVAPVCRGCRGRGWRYVDVGAEWPAKEACRACGDDRAIVAVETGEGLRPVA